MLTAIEKALDEELFAEADGDEFGDVEIFSLDADRRAREGADHCHEDGDDKHGRAEVDAHADLRFADHRHEPVAEEDHDGRGDGDAEIEVGIGLRAQDLVEIVAEHGPRTAIIVHLRLSLIAAVAAVESLVAKVRADHLCERDAAADEQSARPEQDAEAEPEPVEEDDVAEVVGGIVVEVKALEQVCPDLEGALLPVPVNEELRKDGENVVIEHKRPHEQEDETDEPDDAVLLEEGRDVDRGNGDEDGQPEGDQGHQNDAEQNSHDVGKGDALHRKAEDQHDGKEQDGRIDAEVDIVEDQIAQEELEGAQGEPRRDEKVGGAVEPLDLHACRRDREPRHDDGEVEYGEPLCGDGDARFQDKGERPDEGEGNGDRKERRDGRHDRARLVIVAVEPPLQFELQTNEISHCAFPRLSARAWGPCPSVRALATHREQFSERP